MAASAHPGMITEVVNYSTNLRDVVLVVTRELDHGAQTGTCDPRVDAGANAAIYAGTRFACGFIFNSISRHATLATQGQSICDHAGRTRRLRALSHTGILRVIGWRDFTNDEILYNRRLSRFICVYCRKRLLSILSARIFDSSVERGRPRRVAAPEGP